MSVFPQFARLLSKFTGWYKDFGMSRKSIEKNLTKALLNDGELEKELFDYELAEHVDEYLLSKKQDNDKYFFAVTEHTNNVAMLLIDENDVVHVNEMARQRLRTLWLDAYSENIKKLIPDMAAELDAGFLYSAGVKEVENSKSSGLFSFLKKRHL